MKYLYFLIFFFSLNLSSQTKLDGYKYVVCENIEYNNGGKDISFVRAILNPRV